MEDELKSMRNESTTKMEKAKYAMMSWEPTSNLSKEETYEEPEKVVKKPVEKTEKQNMKKNMSDLH